VTVRTRKPFSRRRGDVSQQVRFGVQLLFAAITLWVGIQFVMWVRYFETGGTTLQVERPDGVEAWLPIASLMNLKTLILTPVPEIRAFLGGPYGLVADVKMLNFFGHMGEGTAVFLVVLVGLSLVVKNTWCRYLCPYGALMGLVALESPTRIVRNAGACIDCAK